VPEAERIALLGSGVYFLIGLLTGVWKYRGIMNSPTGQAHPYVDIVHRAALMYAFASLVVEICRAEHARRHCRTVGCHRARGILRHFHLGTATIPRPMIEAFMWSLIAAEVGGFVVLFYGAGRGLSFW